MDSAEYNQEYKRRQKENRLQNWKTKTMNGQPLRQTENDAAKKAWQWLKRKSLERETESMVTAAQDPALRTNYRRKKKKKKVATFPCAECAKEKKRLSVIL